MSDIFSVPSRRHFPQRKVQIDETLDGESEGCSVTVEISVTSESHGYAVLTYVLATVEGAASSADQGMASALNDALASRTTDG